MNLEEFYQQLKDSIRFFGLTWSEKYQLQVSITPQGVVITHPDRRTSVNIQLPNHIQE